MITTPNRLGDAVLALEKGEQVDWRKLADLQALDLAQAGRKFMEQAIEANEQMTLEVAQILKG